MLLDRTWYGEVQLTATSQVASRTFKSILWLRGRAEPTRLPCSLTFKIVFSELVLP